MTSTAGGHTEAERYRFDLEVQLLEARARDVHEALICGRIPVYEVQASYFVDLDGACKHICEGGHGRSTLQHVHRDMLHLHAMRKRLVGALEGVDPQPRVRVLQR